jgi:indolepyruvate ferredoxin oxidoreductase alpha subunit
MDNSTTAMTGHQPHPGTNKTGMGEEVTATRIEEIIKACGVRKIKTIDPINQKEFIKTIKEFLNNKNNEVSVIIAKRPCLFAKV